MNHADENPCVNLTSVGEDLRGLITSQGYIGSSPFKRVSYQTCGLRIHLCHSDFNLGPSSCHYVAMKIFFAALGLRPWVTSTAAVVDHTEQTAAAALVWVSTYLLTLPLGYSLQFLQVPATVSEFYKVGISRLIIYLSC